MEQIIRFGFSLGLAFLLAACGPDIDTTDNTITDNGGEPTSSVEIVVSKDAADSHTLMFSVLAPRAASSWHWDFGDGSSASGTSVTHNYASDGRYTVTVTSPDRSTSASTSVTINSAPVAAFNGAVGGNRTIHLNAGTSTDEGGKITSYHWVFGDGTEDDGKTVTHRYVAAGSYDVTLIVTDNLGDTANITQRYNITAAPLRILPLGDSITQADSQLYSYRYPLWKKLVDRGVSFDFVGSHSTNYGGNPNWPAYNGKQFDPDNEGHWGWRADQIIYDTKTKTGLSTWLKGYDADIALIHIGTNDLIQHQDVEQTAGEIRTIIETLRADNPSITILLSNLIPFQDKPVELDQLNNRIRDLASTLDTTTSRIIFVDQNTGYFISDNQADQVHPNSQTGEAKMAQKWFDALVQTGLI